MKQKMCASNKFQDEIKSLFFAKVHMEPITDLDFVNAHEMNKKYPTTFFLPNENDMTRLTKGCNVKVSLGERFWVHVIKVEGDKITGIVNNALLCDYPVLGDVIQFDKCNVYEVDLCQSK